MRISDWSSDVCSSDLLAMIWQDADNFQIVGIDRVTDDTTIVLTQPTREFTNAWVSPIRRGFSPGDPSRRFSGAKSSINMDFIIEDSRQLTVAAPAQYLAQDIYFEARKSTRLNSSH